MTDTGVLVGSVAALAAAGLLAWAGGAGEPQQPAHQGLKDQYGANAHRNVSQGNQMKLIYTANPQARRATGEVLKEGDEVRVGDNAHTFRMEPCTVTYFREPAEGSSGKVTVKFADRETHSELYVSVIGARWWMGP